MKMLKFDTSPMPKTNKVTLVAPEQLATPLRMKQSTTTHK